jgi:hypothetical protein
MSIVTAIVIWVALNFAIPAFIIWQRSPRFRHQLFQWMIGTLLPALERGWTHKLVQVVRRQR